MPRPPRITLPDIPRLVVQRGHNKLPCFYDGIDYNTFIDYLIDCAQRTGCRIHAWALTPSSYWLLVSPAASDGLSRMIQTLGRRYVQAANRRYGRTGTLWEGRYRACLVEPESYLLTCQHYIETAALREKLATNLDAWPWSSFSHYAHGKPCDWIAEHAVVQGLDSNIVARQRRYLALFDSPLEPDAIRQIEKTLDAGLVPGGDVFKARLEESSDVKVRPQRRGRPPKSGKIA